MSSGTVGSTSAYQSGKGISFAKEIGSRVLAAAQSAKDEKKLQDEIEADGGEVPESAKKGLFATALKQQFITNPVNDLKKGINKKIAGAANVAGFFGAGGRSLEDKILGKSLKINRGGFDRSGYKKGGSDDDDDGGGSGGGGGGTIATLGALVLDVQSIASAVSSMQGLINTQMGLTSQMGNNLEEIKNVLSEQVSLQQQRIENEERAAMESSLESSQQVSGTDKGTSAFTEGGMDIFSMFGDLKNLFGILKSLPQMFMGLLKGIVSKIPGGKFLLDKFGGGAAKKVAGEAAETGAKGLLGKILRPIFKRIPIIGGLIDFAVSLALGESVGRAAAKAAGATLGGALGGILGSVFPGPGTVVGGLLGGFAGDWVGGSLYDMIEGAFRGNKEEKMAAGGVMIGEAGKEAVVDLNSSEGRDKLGGSNANMDDAGQSYYSAIAGSTLAVTKEFIDGMGPIGSSVAPIIQDDIAKLGKTFDLPATSIKMSVGGAGLNPVAGAEKKGEKFLEDLVSGSLEKVKAKEDKNKNKGGGGGGDPNPAPTGDDTTNAPTSTPTGAAPTGAAPKPTAASFAKQQLEKTTPGTQRSYGNDEAAPQFGINNKNLQKVGGGNPGKYYYDGFGNIYAIDKDEKRSLSKDEIKSGVPGSAGNFNFFRNLNSGVVNLTTHQDAKATGWYDYASNAVSEIELQGAGKYPRTIWKPSSKSSQFKNQFTEATPYGKSKISAEGGASDTLKKLGNGKLADAPRGRCVTGVLETMAVNKIPNPPETGQESNHPRGLAAQLIKNYGWGSISGLGSKSNLKSSYGNVGVNTMDFGQWKTAVKSNKIPSGAIIFMTKNQDWSTNRSSGHDASIAKDGGKKLWSGHWQTQSDGVGAVYGSASNKIIALTPGGQQIPYEGSTSGDDGGDRKEGESSNTPEDMLKNLEKGLLGMLSAAGAFAETSNQYKPGDTNVEKYNTSKTKWEEFAKKYSSTGNVTAASNTVPNTNTTPPVTAALTVGGASSMSAMIPVGAGALSGGEGSLSGPSVPSTSSTPYQLNPLL